MDLVFGNLSADCHVVLVSETNHIGYLFSWNFFPPLKILTHMFPARISDWEEIEAKVN